MMDCHVKFTRPKLKELSSNVLDEIVCDLIVIFGQTKGYFLH